MILKKRKTSIKQISLLPFEGVRCWSFHLVFSFPSVVAIHRQRWNNRDVNGQWRWHRERQSCQRANLNSCLHASPCRFCVDIVNPLINVHKWGFVFAGHPQPTNVSGVYWLGDEWQSLKTHCWNTHVWVLSRGGLKLLSFITLLHF